MWLIPCLVRKPSHLFPTSTKIYSYELQDIHDRLELLFPDLSDPRYNLFSIIDYIHEAWPLSLTVKNIKSKKRKIKPKS
jgi:hypothetical protein